jgi:hypothetical protein
MQPGPWPGDFAFAARFCCVVAAKAVVVVQSSAPVLNPAVGAASVSNDANRERSVWLN